MQNVDSFAWCILAQIPGTPRPISEARIMNASSRINVCYGPDCSLRTQWLNVEREADMVTGINMNTQTCTQLKRGKGSFSSSVLELMHRCTCGKGWCTLSTLICQNALQLTPPASISNLLLSSSPHCLTIEEIPNRVWWSPRTWVVSPIWNALLPNEFQEVIPSIMTAAWQWLQMPRVTYNAICVYSVALQCAGINVTVNICEPALSKYHTWQAHCHAFQW